MRPSRSRPDQGLIKVRTTALNQDGEAVLIYVGNLIVRGSAQMSIEAARDLHPA